LSSVFPFDQSPYRQSRVHQEYHPLLVAVQYPEVIDAPKAVCCDPNNKAPAVLPDVQDCADDAQ